MYNSRPKRKSHQLFMLQKWIVGDWSSIRTNAPRTSWSAKQGFRSFCHLDYKLTMMHPCICTISCGQQGLSDITNALCIFV